MARNLEVGALIGTYVDGTNLLPLMRSQLKDTLATIGITGNGSPVIHLIGLNGTSEDPFSLKLNNISNITSVQNTADIYYIDVAINSDNINIPIDNVTLSTDTPSASATIRLNYYFEPVYI